ncbi:MAG: acetate kinase [Candidatus Micrarchaeia archaeon]|jgi:acetate kinase
MKILVLNCGSTSIKYKLFNFSEKKGAEPNVIAHDYIENIKNQLSFETYLKNILNNLLKKGKIKSLDEINAIGHRVVHGGDFSKSVVITPNILEKIKKNSNLAPLHNPSNIKGIEIMKKELPKVKQIAVFDTAFHQTMPEKAFMYALPYAFYSKHKIRKYGFHGTSHKYVALEASKKLKKPLNKLNLITCHLGGGSSICAIKQGKSIDTSMGFTPLEGLIMTTRCGDIDPAIIFYLNKNLKISLDDIETLVNKKSGTYGISGISANFKEVLDKAEKGHKKSRLAYDMFIYRIQKYIGAYSVILGKLDAIIFTAGIGEKSKKTRKEIMKAFPKVKSLVINTDEEKMIAIETKTLI